MKCLRLGIFLVSFGTPQKLEVVMNSRMGLTSTATNLTNITKQYLSSKLDQLKKIDLTTVAVARGLCVATTVRYASQSDLTIY